jgi:hypothetical protein
MIHVFFPSSYLGEMAKPEGAANPSIKQIKVKMMNLAEQKIRQALKSGAKTRPLSVYHSLRSGTMSPKYDMICTYDSCALSIVVFGGDGEARGGRR